MGKVFRFHKDVDTDQIIASQYLLYPTVEEMKEHTFESLDSEFAKKVQKGDVVVAHENFGCGSSREQAPAVLKALGVKAVIAGSFARIFYRNAINIGLLVIINKELYYEVQSGDTVDVDLEKGLIITEKGSYPLAKLPKKMQEIMDMGGLIAALNKEA
ncbi:MAG: 3-isopropylmalate dehydratase small subunit [Lachnospiraceae bacterium]|nr:3-isopropylmalate dehydratase small subunit [Lachnospiraceae bacterium]